MGEIVKCVNCDRWDLRNATEAMARRGWGTCDRDDVWVCYAADKPRQCEHFTEAQGDTVAKREAWLARQREGVSA